MALCVALGLTAFAATASAAPGDVDLVSRATGPGGPKGNDFSTATPASSVSADGRYVTFFSNATNLDPADTDGIEDVFVRDLTAGTTTLVSRATGPAGAKANNHSSDPAISADGRYVTFRSAASNLDPADTDGTVDVFVRDLQAGTTTLVSRATGPAGAKGNHESFEPAISADGRYVTFTSNATNLDPADTDPFADVFVRDLTAVTTTLVSRATGATGAKGNNGSGEPAISADGRYVTFSSVATNLDPADTDTFQDVFVRDLSAGTTTLVSRATGPTGAKANNQSGEPAISADGRYVTFFSFASNLDPADTDGTVDVFVRDLQAGTTTLVSRATGPAGAKGNHESFEPAISADGRYVTFSSSATNLDPADTDTTQDVFVRDLTANTTTLVSRATGPTGAKGNNGSGEPAISADGRYVTFGSNASNLHPDDTDTESDVFRRELPPASTINTPPVATDDAYAVNGGATLIVGTPGVLGNDTDADNDALSAQLVDAPTKGTLTLNPDGSFTYTPGEDATGTDSFTYRASDGTATSTLATVTITIVDVTPPDAPVLTGSDPVSPANDMSPRIKGAAEAGSTVQLFTNATCTGSSVASGSAGLFTSPGSTVGVADDSTTTFYATATDTAGNESDCSASGLTYVEDSTPPDTIIDTGPAEGSTTTITTATFTFHATETGSAFACKLDTGPVQACDAGTKSYTDLSGGSHTFSVVATDAAGNADPSAATRTWTINTPPVATDDAYAVIGGATLTVAAPGVLGNDTDADHDPLTAQLATTTTKGMLNLNPDGSFTYTPGEDATGSDTFTYRASDGLAASNLASVTITITPGCDGVPATRVGTAGNDTLTGTGGNDVIVALGGNDTIDTGSGNDRVCGGSGNDTIELASGNDRGFGGTGTDNLRGGSGDDILSGGEGNDTLDGGGDRDALFGDAGVDRLFGGGDPDALDGGDGSPDLCDGEGGNDTATAACEQRNDI